MGDTSESRNPTPPEAAEQSIGVVAVLTLIG